MLDIIGKSQIEIEEMFSQENLKEYMSLQLDMFISQMNDEHFKILSQYVPIGMEEEYMYKIISFLGDNSVGNELDTGDRRIDMEYAVSYFSTLFEELDFNNKVQRAVDIIAEFDTILFDLEQHNLIGESGNWYTETSLVVQFNLGTDTKINEYQNLVRFRLPMIEEPQQHKVGQRGGYILNPNRVTTNRGEQHQPQNCLDVLNKLQSNAYILRDIDVNDERAIVMKKLTDDNWKYPNKSKEVLFENNTKKCDQIMLTTQETYEAMYHKQFYFPWRFDCRGRMYSVGYDINLQSTKYKKASLKLIEG